MREPWTEREVGARNERRRILAIIEAPEVASMIGIHGPEVVAYLRGRIEGEPRVVVEESSP